MNVWQFPLKENSVCISAKFTGNKTLRIEHGVDSFRASILMARGMNRFILEMYVNGFEYRTVLLFSNNHQRQAAFTSFYFTTTKFSECTSRKIHACSGIYAVSSPSEGTAVPSNECKVFLVAVKRGLRPMPNIL